MDLSRSADCPVSSLCLGWVRRTSQKLKVTWVTRLWSYMDQTGGLYGPVTLCCLPCLILVFGMGPPDQPKTQSGLGDQTPELYAPDRWVILTCHALASALAHHSVWDGSARPAQNSKCSGICTCHALASALSHTGVWTGW